MSLYMETTRISAERTAAEISSLLARAGAREVLTEYDQTRKVTAISFALFIKEERVPFQMPVRCDAIFNKLQARRRGFRKAKSVELDCDQSYRIAWRMALRWLQAQVAYIETGMVTPQEVFLPYMSVSLGVTLHQLVENGGVRKLMLPPPSE